jgi:hypothetical protein
MASRRGAIFILVPSVKVIRPNTRRLLGQRRSRPSPSARPRLGYRPSPRPAGESRMGTRIARTSGVAAGLVLAAIACDAEPTRDVPLPARGATTAGWPAYGGDAGGSRYSPLAEIHRGNVADLEVAWTYRTGDFCNRPGAWEGSSFESTPIVVDGLLVLSTSSSRVIALDPERAVRSARRREGAAHGAVRLRRRGRAAAVRSARGMGGHPLRGVRASGGCISLRVDARPDVLALHAATPEHRQRFAKTAVTSPSPS